MTLLLSQLLLLKLLVLSLAGAQLSSPVPPDADDDLYEYYLPENDKDITSPELKNLVRPNGDQW